MSTTTTNPLILTGDDLAAASRVATWAVWDAAYRWRDVQPGGGSVMAGDESYLLIEQVDLAEALHSIVGFPDDDVYIRRPLEPRHVVALRFAAESAIEEVEGVDGSWTSAEAMTRLERDGRAVLTIVKSLEVILPPVPSCEACGQEVAR